MLLSGEMSVDDRCAMLAADARFGCEVLHTLRPAERRNVVAGIIGHANRIIALRTAQSQQTAARAVGS